MPIVHGFGFHLTNVLSVKVYFWGPQKKRRQNDILNIIIVLLTNVLDIII